MAYLKFDKIGNNTYIRYHRPVFKVHISGRMSNDGEVYDVSVFYDVNAKEFYPSGNNYNMLFVGVGFKSEYQLYKTFQKYKII